MTPIKSLIGVMYHKSTVKLHLGYSSLEFHCREGIFRLQRGPAPDNVFRQQTIVQTRGFQEKKTGVRVGHESSFMPHCTTTIYILP